VPQDFQKALRWLETAANMGFVEAKINIAYMYLEVKHSRLIASHHAQTDQQLTFLRAQQGKGVSKDLMKARALYSQVPESELSKQMIAKIDNGEV